MLDLLNEFPSDSPEKPILSIHTFDSFGNPDTDSLAEKVLEGLEKCKQGQSFIVVLDGMPISSDCQVITHDMAAKMQLLTQFGFGVKNAYEYTLYANQSEYTKRSKSKSKEKVESRVLTVEELVDLENVQIREAHVEHFSKWREKYRQERLESREVDIVYQQIEKLSQIEESDSSLQGRIIISPEGLDIKHYNKHIQNTVAAITLSQNMTYSDVLAPLSSDSANIIRKAIISSAIIRRIRTTNLADKITDLINSQKIPPNILFALSPGMDANFGEVMIERDFDIDYSYYTLNPINKILYELSTLEGAESFNYKTGSYSDMEQLYLQNYPKRHSPNCTIWEKLLFDDFIFSITRNSYNDQYGPETIVPATFEIAKEYDIPKFIPEVIFLASRKKNKQSMLQAFLQTFKKYFADRDFIDHATGILEKHLV